MGFWDSFGSPITTAGAVPQASAPQPVQQQQTSGFWGGFGQTAAQGEPPAPVAQKPAPSPIPYTPEPTSTPASLLTAKDLVPKTMAFPVGAGLPQGTGPGTQKGAQAAITREEQLGAQPVPQTSYNMDLGQGAKDIARTIPGP